MEENNLDTSIKIIGSIEYDDCWAVTRNIGFRFSLSSHL